MTTQQQIWFYKTIFVPFFPQDAAIRLDIIYYALPMTILFACVLSLVLAPIGMCDTIFFVASK